jgi:hypothetical protein
VDSREYVTVIRARVQRFSRYATPIQHLPLGVVLTIRRDRALQSVIFKEHEASNVVVWCEIRTVYTPNRPCK